MLLTLLQFFATKFLFLAFHLESGERLLSRSPLFVLILSAVHPFAAGRISDFSGWFCGAIRFFLALIAFFLFSLDDAPPME